MNGPADCMKRLSSAEFPAVCSVHCYCFPGYFLFGGACGDPGGAADHGSQSIENGGLSAADDICVLFHLLREYGKNTGSEGFFLHAFGKEYTAGQCGILPGDQQCAVRDPAQPVYG